MATITARAREGRASVRPPAIRPTSSQREWLKRGVDQAGGKLPLFDRQGQLYPERTIRSCVEHGWAQPWFNNPMKPDWLICRLTAAGRKIIAER